MPPLGYIEPKNRTQAQHDAHQIATSNTVRFALAPRTLAKGEKIMLTDFWRKPEVVADVGYEFNGFHQLTGSCFPAGTPVRLADGRETAVEAVQVGDEVISHTGQARRVVDTMTRLFTGDLVTAHVAGFPFPLEMTADHEVAVMCGAGDAQWLSWRRADHLQEGDRVLIGWDRGESPAAIDVAELLGDRAVVLDELMKDEAYTKGQEPDVPVSNITMARHVVRRSGIDWHGKVKLVRSRCENAMPRYIPVSPSLARFVGLYLAEGGCETDSETGKVVFTFSADEEALCGEVLALARGLFGAEGKTFVSNSRGTSRKVTFGNSTLAAVLKALVPGNVYSKRVPGVFFRADAETKAALILGWLHGDGYTALTGRRGVEPRIQGVTASVGLARDMVTLALSAGMGASATKRKPRGRSREAYDVYLTGRKAVSLFPALVAARQAIGVQARPDSAQVNRTPYGYTRRVKKVERRAVEDFRVFDFEVEEDHSFIAGGLTVHNCVGASAGNAIFTLAAVQRMLTSGTTKAFVPWWPFPYGRTRYNEGDRGQGEGAVDSVIGETLRNEGVFDINQPGLPAFKSDDGLYLTSGIELQWSDGARIDQKWASVAKQFPLGSAATLSSPQDIATANINGYPVLDGCSMYIGNGGIKGSGADAYVAGHYDGRGGHSTCFLGVWNHPNDGMLYLYSNQWPTSTYPKDPAGAGRCCVWTPESEVQKLFSRYGGDGGETMALSHLTYLPAQPAVMNFASF